MDKFKLFQIIDFLIAFTGLGLFLFGFWMFNQNVSVYISLVAGTTGAILAFLGVSSIVDMFFFKVRMRRP